MYLHFLQLHSLYHQKAQQQERPDDCEHGSIRFNTDTSNLEYFRGKTLGWSQFELVTRNLGGGTGSNTGFGVRASFADGLGLPVEVHQYLF